MTTNILESEAEKCLAGIFTAFSHSARNLPFPLTDLAHCRLFAATVTRTMTSLWSPEAKLPPTALILAMIRVCSNLANPSSATMSLSAANLGIPRPFAQEMLERLQVELPPTAHQALDQVGRIVNEAGNLSDSREVRRAFEAYRARNYGALWAKELDQMVRATWSRRYSLHAHLGDSIAARRAA